ncbi:MAG TPA: DoxX family protein [Candidatus Sulfotelmatobacter sp.]|nr:DoxX family protein [Candidatus Sulfotelmatobacter sp.]
MFHLEQFTSLGLLLMRIMVGVVYAGSGLKDLKDPAARAKSIGQSQGFTIFLSVAEIAGGAGIILGVLQQLAVLGLLAIMAGAIQKKVVVWKTGFWGKDGGEGWYYDLTFVSTLLVILFTNGGDYVLMH